MRTRIRPKTTVLLLSLAMPLTVDAAEVRITSVTEKLDGVKVEWSHSEEGYAYTLQERTSWTSGNWEDVWTRYRWPSTTTRWTAPGVFRERRRFRFYRVVAEPIRIPERGKVLATELLRRFSLSQARSVIASDGAPTEDALWPVHYYQIVYETVDPFGLPIPASGGLFVPQGVEKALPLLSYQHGTEIYKLWVPSQDDSFWFPRALLPASSGYVTLMPDYLGLGESPGLHPYLHAKTEATAVVDMLRAVKTFCADNDIALNSQLFLVGGSQGGHATAAVHREIELQHADEFRITASAPMSAPFDLSGTLDHLLTNRNYPEPFFYIFFLSAALPVYDLADTLEELLAVPYKRALPPLFDGNHRDEIFASMGPDVQSMLAPDFRDALLNDPAHPLRLAAEDNDLLDWAPQAPMRLYHCAGDVIVPYENSVLAQQSYTENGACCVELIDPGAPATLGHGACFWPSFLDAKAWFDSLRQ